MLREGIEGTVDLRKMFNELNSEYFGGAVPSCKLQWSGKLKVAVGLAHVRYKGQKHKKRPFDKWIDEIPVDDVEIIPNSLKIQMSKSFDMQIGDIQAVMLHEMVHILLFSQMKVSGHHRTPEFDGWINKLRGISGLDVPFFESAFKKSPKLKAKEGYVLLIWQSNGKYGIVSYSKNFLTKKWMLFAKMMSRIVGSSPKVTKAEMFKVKHQMVSKLTANRSLKGLTWIITDEDTAREIQRGKSFMTIDHMGVIINPSKAGINVANLKKGTDVKFDKYGEWLNTEVLL